MRFVCLTKFMLKLRLKTIKCDFGMFHFSLDQKFNVKPLFNKTFS